jgi:hypothetical protein
VVHQEPQNRARSWGYIARVTLIGTAISLAFSLLFNYLLLFSETLTPFTRSMIAAVALPILIGAPLSLLFGYCLQEISRQRRELTHSSSHDRVTAFFNGSAFASLVDRRAASSPKEGPRQGAFLIINAENLSAINMRYALAGAKRRYASLPQRSAHPCEAKILSAALAPASSGFSCPVRAKRMRARSASASAQE